MPEAQRASGKPGRPWAIALVFAVLLGGGLLALLRQPGPPAGPPVQPAASASAPSGSASHGARAHRHDHGHAHEARSARPEGSVRPTTSAEIDPEILAATESAKSASSNRDPRENVPAPAEVVRMLDEIIERLEGERAAASAAGDARRADRLGVRLARLRRDRERNLLQMDGGAAAPPPAGASAGGPPGEPP